MTQLPRSVICIVGIAFVVLCLAWPTEAQLQCRSDSNSITNWWVAFKYPAARSYSYTDANTTKYAVATSKKSFNTGSNSCLSYTLSQLWSSNKKSYVIYNDQPAGGAKRDELFNEENMDQEQLEAIREFATRESVDDAHAKGIIAVDDNGYGFWLIHSTPLFPLGPTQTQTFTYMDDSQVIKGQNFLCVSFKSWSTFNSIGYQLQVIKPDVYSQSFSTKGQSSAPNLYQAAVGGVYLNSAIKNKVTLTSTTGTKFYSFAKSGYYGSGWDLYDEYVSPTLGQSMAVETWRIGVGTPLEKNCTVSGGYKVVNVNQLSMNGNSWGYTADHSKWAISSAASTWFCGCDINRMASQGKRGGGCLCFQNGGVRNFLSGAITAVDSC